MRTPEQWLADQIGDRPDDFAPDESPIALAFIRAIQRDAIEAARTEHVMANAEALRLISGDLTTREVGLITGFIAKADSRLRVLLPKDAP